MTAPVCLVFGQESIHGLYRQVGDGLASFLATLSRRSACLKPSTIANHTLPSIWLSNEVRMLLCSLRLLVAIFPSTTAHLEQVLVLPSERRRLLQGGLVLSMM